MRVVVTGLGIVSPLGASAAATMDAVSSARRAFREVTLFDVAHQRTKLGAEVQDLVLSDVVPAGEIERWSRTDAMALLAAREALGMARVEPARAPTDLVVAGTTGGMFETEALLAAMHRDPSLLSPMQRMLSHPLSATGDRLSTTLGPFPRVRTLCSACAGGADAILLGASWIQAGRSARVLCGGADGLCLLTFTGFNALGATDPEGCRPFDRRRAGMSLGEGAGFVLLEAEDEARARGAVPIAELSGWATAAEAHHITNPEERGKTAAEVITRALARAGVSPRELDYVNAHATGTPLGDAMEARALASALGSEVLRVPVSSTKGQMGHTLGAAGAIEAAITILAIERGVLPPTGGLVTPDSSLAHIVGALRTGPVRVAMSSSFGFGGADTVLLFRRPDCSGAARTTEPRAVVITGSALVGPSGIATTSHALSYLDGGAAPPEGIGFDAAAHLDLGRARRMDRGARMLTCAMKLALEEAGSRAPAGDDGPIGAVGGAAYGSVDASAAFVRSVFEKGPRAASPIVFPNLVPSSPAGHASIYLGLSGPVLTVLDLAVTAEAAFGVAWELIALGEADAMIAGAVEERSLIAEHVLGPLCADASACPGQRSEGSGAIVLEEAARAACRGARILARVLSVEVGRGRWAPSLPGPASPRPFVILARDGGHAVQWLSGTRWNDAPRAGVAARAGHHEGVGAFAIVAAVAALSSGRADEVLVLGSAKDRWSALHLGAA
jgi:3-oxoacyl-[acyl-carrier-protein] synthase II